MTQGERVKAIRKELNMTLEQFGEKLGVTKTAISYVENNKRNLTEQMLLSICREFGVNEIWLRTGEGDVENMFTKLSDDDRYSINLGKLSITENQLAKNMLNAIAEASPEKLKHIEEFMKACLGIEN
ncbi:helix-turn-helix domain-containing protein [Faecalicatena sp. BF-R-105]|nr:helix-turn-helix domain-containing protein [Faecalicatena sp. BF-R-105]HCS83866.1 XRE family transcriptional regulator [Lachnospiraceae bacterium]